MFGTDKDIYMFSHSTCLVQVKIYVLSFYMFSTGKDIYIYVLSFYMFGTGKDIYIYVLSFYMFSTGTDIYICPLILHV
jgi:hypothetical protein